MRKSVKLKFFLIYPEAYKLYCLHSNFFELYEKYFNDYDIYNYYNFIKHGSKPLNETINIRTTLDSYNYFENYSIKASYNPKIFILLQ
jgi:hypothetical protein